MKRKLCSSIISICLLSTLITGCDDVEEAVLGGVFVTVMVIAIGKKASNEHTTRSDEEYYNDYMSHEQRVDEFVKLLEAKSGHKLDVYKYDTEQSGYAVIYNRDTKELNAYWITENYADLLDLESYLGNGKHKFGLERVEDHDLYYHAESGLYFEEGYASSRSVSAAQEHFVNTSLQEKAQAIMEQYALSHQRATELATLAENYYTLWQTGALTERELNELSIAATGTSATEFTQVIRDNDETKFCEIIRRAAQQNSTGVEHAQTLLLENFGLKGQFPSPLPCH